MLETALIQHGRAIFENRYPVSLTYVELETILPDASEVVVRDEINLDMSDCSGVQFFRTSSAQDAIIDMMSGRPRLTGNKRTDEMIMNGRLTKSLSINEIIELWDGIRVLRLKKATDLVTIHNTIDMYLDEVEAVSRISPNYKRPPEEDMEKMKGFMTDIRSQRPGIEFADGGNDSWSQLMSLFGGVSFSSAEDTEEASSAKVATIGTKSRTPSPVASSSDPFAFLRG